MLRANPERKGVEVEMMSRNHYWIGKGCRWWWSWRWRHRQGNVSQVDTCEVGSTNIGKRVNVERITAADDLAAVIPPPASSWHKASPSSLHQQAIPHKRKATDLADSTRRHPFKLLPFLCWHKEKGGLQAFFLSIPFHNHKGLLNQQERSKLTYPWRTAFQQRKTSRCWSC